MKPGAWCSPKMEEVTYSSACPDSISEALRSLLAAPRLHNLELTPRNMTLSPEHMHILGAHLLAPACTVGMQHLTSGCMPALRTHGCMCIA